MLSLGNRFREYRPEDEIAQLRSMVRDYEASDHCHCQQSNFWLGVAIVEFVMLMIVVFTKQS